MLTDFSEHKEVTVFFEVFKNVIVSDRNSLKTVVQTQTIPYYWQVGQEFGLLPFVLRYFRQIDGAFLHLPLLKCRCWVIS